MRGLERQYGDEVLAMPCDIGDADAVRAAYLRIVQRFGPVHVLVNNAGILSNHKIEATSSETEWRRRARGQPRRRDVLGPGPSCRR